MSNLICRASGMLDRSKIPAEKGAAVKRGSEHRQGLLDYRQICERFPEYISTLLQNVRERGILPVTR